MAQKGELGVFVNAHAISAREGLIMLYYDYANHIVPQLLCLCADPEGGGGPDTSTLKTNKAAGFHSNSGPNPLKNHKATKLGPSSPRQRYAILWLSG